LRISLTGGGNERLMSAPCPSLMDTGILAKTGFVGKEQSRATISGFFLAWDKCIAATDLVRPDRPWPISAAAVAPRIPFFEELFAHVQCDSAPRTLL
jgi:hypothetical protein